MKIECKRSSLTILPESAQDRAFIEDTLGLDKTGTSLKIERIDDVRLGFAEPETFVLKVEGKKNE